MDRHLITEDQINKWRSEHWVTFASSAGKGSQKRLEVGLDGLYRVTDHGATIYIGGSAATAVREYNSAR